MSSRLKRIKHWDTQAYHHFLLDSQHIPFAWGTHDCSTFVADGVLAITGVDIAADFRGKYSDHAGAFAAITSVCGGSTVADAIVYCASKYNLVEWKHPKMARRGDVVTFEANGSLVAGLIHLSGRHIVAVGEQGLYRFPISRVIRSWHYE
jgi:uncharacterized protein DUF6950